MNLKEATLFVARFRTGDYTPGEHAAFLRWSEGASIEDLGVIADEQEILEEQWSLPAVAPSSAWVEQLERKLDRLDRPDLKKGRVIVKKMDAGWKFKWVAAASLVGLLAGGGLWYFHQAGAGPGSSGKPAEALSKSFSTPRGGVQQQFELADGSKVWLNAASTLKYPVSFGVKDRSVELSGEAYFEIAKNADLPFRVKIREAQVEVLGTHFNIMAYEDEPVSKTTLVEGAIKVIRGSEERLLQPGEQAELAYPSSGAFTPISLIQGVDQEAVLAWKAGYLEFKNDDLHTVMREIARCYNVEIRYEGNIPEKRFTGNFSRKDDLRQILKQLEYQHIHFRITGKTVTVTL